MEQHISADQVRRARRALGITQATLAQETGVNVTLIKHFETYRLDNPPQDFQFRLSDYFASKGVDLASGGGPSSLGTMPSGTVPITRGAFPVPVGTHAPRMSFVVSGSLSDEEVEAALTRMDEHDDEIALLIGRATEKSLFGRYTDETVLDSQRLFGLMAENYMLFRYLQGRNFLEGIDPTASDETHGHIVHRAASESPLVTAASASAPPPGVESTASEA